MTDHRGVNVVPGTHITGYLDTVGVKADGTLWISDATGDRSWNGDKMNRFGDGTDWRQVVRSSMGVLLLKNDGTLWRWGTNHFEWNRGPTKWPNLRACQPYQIGTDNNWKDLYGSWIHLAQKSDGSVWSINWDEKTRKDELHRETNLDQVPLQALSLSGSHERAYVRPDGTLWMSCDNAQNEHSDFVRIGTGTNWTAVVSDWREMVALKSDGSLWQWRFNRQWDDNQKYLLQTAQTPPVRLGIHNDWVTITSTWGDVIALAADGSLWLWPVREEYEQDTLLRLPKQPKFLGNVFAAGQ